MINKKKQNKQTESKNATASCTKSLNDLYSKTRLVTCLEVPGLRTVPVGGSEGLRGPWGPSDTTMQKLPNIHVLSADINPKHDNQQDQRCI